MDGYPLGLIEVFISSSVLLLALWEYRKINRMVQEDRAKAAREKELRDGAAKDPNGATGEGKAHQEEAA